jgi:NAD+ diphosphatase
VTTPIAEAAYLFKGGDLILSPSGGAAFSPSVLDSLPLAGRRFYAVSRGRGHVFCEAVRLAPEASLQGLGQGVAQLPFRAALGGLDVKDTAPVTKGLALLNWLEVSQFCGVCGGKLEDVVKLEALTALEESVCKESEVEEGLRSGARRCMACGHIHFPRICPAVIILVRRGGKILLAHNASFPEGRFGLIAGFVEAGENLEDAARRELREEASVEVGSLVYKSSQPWPFPDSLMLAFEAEWASGEGRPDGVEITELRWCGPDELPSIPPPGSVARALIEGFLKGGTAGGGAS